jgi:beta-glucosidase
MTAYNKLNGTHCGENPQLVDILRQQWGLKHILTISDFVWGIRDGPTSVKAGLDVEYPSPAIRSKTLPAVLASGDLDWALIEQIGKRLPTTQLTHFARVYDSPTPAKAVICSREHRGIAHDAAVASMVLLKNKSQSGNPLLPLDQESCKRIIVVGTLAVSTPISTIRTSSRLWEA